MHYPKCHLARNIIGISPKTLPSTYCTLSHQLCTFEMPPTPHAEQFIHTFGFFCGVEPQLNLTPATPACVAASCYMRPSWVLSHACHLWWYVQSCHSHFGQLPLQRHLTYINVRASCKQVIGGDEGLAMATYCVWHCRLSSIDDTDYGLWFPCQLQGVLWLGNSQGEGVGAGAEVVQT